VDWSTQANASGILPRSAWHWGVDSSAINYPLEAPSRTPLFLCHPTVGELQVVTVISPVFVGLFMEKTKDKCLSKARTPWYRSTCLASLSWGQPVSRTAQGSWYS
jgi:hypothetical protein